MSDCDCCCGRGIKIPIEHKLSYVGKPVFTYICLHGKNMKCYNNGAGENTKKLFTYAQTIAEEVNKNIVY